MFKVPRTPCQRGKNTKKRSMKTTKEGLEQQELNLRSMKYDFSLFSKFGESMLMSLKKLNRSLDREKLSHKNQSAITSFFSKQ